jgi:hypothetical protein
MPITDLDTSWREIGRIRTGSRGADGDGAPRSLVTFRLTSASETAVRAAAGVYGGTARPWRSPAGPAWEVITEAAELDVAVPPGSVFSQWWERWTAAGRERQCDGHYDRQGERPCICPVDVDERLAEAKRQRACRPITRLALILPRLPDLGVWRLEAHGLIAARELGATMRAVTAATDAGHYVPGVLRLEQRQTRRPGEKPHDYGIPVLELPQLRAQDLLPGDPDRMQLALGGQWRRLEEPPLLEEGEYLPPRALVADELHQDLTLETIDEDALEDERTTRALVDELLPIQRGGIGEPSSIPPSYASAIVDAAWPNGTPYGPDEIEERLQELEEVAAAHRRTPAEARRFLAEEAGLEEDRWAEAGRRTWARVLVKLHAGDYDLSPLERATIRAAQATAEQAARDPRTGQVPPDPLEIEPPAVQAASAGGGAAPDPEAGSAGPSPVGGSDAAP